NTGGFIAGGDRPKARRPCERIQLQPMSRDQPNRGPRAVRLAGAESDVRTRAFASRFLPALDALAAEISARYAHAELRRWRRQDALQGRSRRRCDEAVRRDLGIFEIRSIDFCAGMNSDRYGIHL